MENRFWTVTYRNRDNGQRITAAVFAADQQQAQEKARADGRIDGRDVWEIESIEPHEEPLARVLIAEFSKKQQGGHFACPRCREDDDGLGERRAQRPEPPRHRLYLRCLWDAGSAGGHDGQPHPADRMGYRRRAGKLAHGGRRQ